MGETSDERLRQIAATAEEVKCDTEIMAFGFNDNTEETLAQVAGRGSYAVLPVELRLRVDLADAGRGRRPHVPGPNVRQREPQRPPQKRWRHTVVMGTVVTVSARARACVSVHYLNWPQTFSK